MEIHALCQRYGVPFFINDNVDIALQCHAEGVHVGQEDMAAAQVRARVGDGMMIGVSVHNVAEALEAVKNGELTIDDQAPTEGAIADVAFEHVTIDYV